MTGKFAALQTDISASQHFGVITLSFKTCQPKLMACTPPPTPLSPDSQCEGFPAFISHLLPSSISFLSCNPFPSFFLHSVSEGDPNGYSVAFWPTYVLRNDEHKAYTGPARRHSVPVAMLECYRRGKMVRQSEKEGVR